MVTVKGKKGALITGILCISIVISLIITSRDYLLSYWYIYKLSSDNNDARKDAALKLAGIRFKAAIPFLIEGIIKNNKEGVQVVVFDGGGIAICRNPLRDDIRGRNKEDMHIELNPFGYSLYLMGDLGIPLIDDALRNVDAFNNIRAKHVFIAITEAVANKEIKVILSNDDFPFI